MKFSKKITQFLFLITPLIYGCNVKRIDGVYVNKHIKLDISIDSIYTLTWYDERGENELDGKIFKNQDSYLTLGEVKNSQSYFVKEDSIKSDSVTFLVFTADTLPYSGELLINDTLEIFVTDKLSIKKIEIKKIEISSIVNCKPTLYFPHNEGSNLFTFYYNDDYNCLNGTRIFFKRNVVFIAPHFFSKKIKLKKVKK